MKKGKRTAIAKKIQEIEKKEETIEDLEERIEDLQEKSEETLDKLDEGEKRIERAVLALGRFTIRKKYLLETTRVMAGAALGVSVGMSLRIIPEIAKNLPWANIIGIFSFIMFISIVLVYKSEHIFGRSGVIKKLVEIMLISVFVEVVTLYLFNILPSDPETLLKVVVVGLFPTMSGAITFRIME